MVICHATGFHAHCYLPLVGTFASQFTVWGVDLRAHGQSQIDPERTIDWNGFVEDLLATLEHIRAVHRVADAAIPAFGHSMGGATILKAEAERAGSIAKAFVYEPIIFPDRVQNRKSEMSANATKRRAEFGSRAEALLRYASRPPLNGWRADALHAYVEHGFVDTPDGVVRLACLPRFEAMTFDTADTRVNEIAAVQMPVVVAQGRLTPNSVSAADFAGPTADGLPNATLSMYGDLTHFGPFEAPERIAGDAVEFFTRRC